MSGTQLSVSQGGSSGVTTLLDLPEDSEIRDQEKTTTAAAFLGCVSTSAQNDERLTEEQTRSLLIEPTSKKKDVISATEVGNRVGKFGDELERVRQQLGSDQDFTDFVENAVRDTNGTQAFEEFTGIANQVLEVGDSGLASGISYGRIATLFLLGYELCSAFIRRHGTPLFMKFIGRLLNYLIKFLKDIGFFDWLVRHSWGQLTANTVEYAVGLGQGLVLGAIAAGLVAVTVFWYYRRRSS